MKYKDIKIGDIVYHKDNKVEYKIIDKNKYNLTVTLASLSIPRFGTRFLKNIYPSNLTIVEENKMKLTEALTKSSSLKWTINDIVRWAGGENHLISKYRAKPLADEHEMSKKTQELYSLLQRTNRRHWEHNKKLEEWMGPSEEQIWDWVYSFVPDPSDWENAK